MTIKLYDDNPYETSFSAKVLSCIKVNDEYDVVLDQTLFFPTSGGQSCDKGSINDIQVTHVEIEGETIHHFLNDAVEGRIKGNIDFEHRYDLMQNHSGEHLFSGVVHQLYDYDNVGFHLGENEMTVDFNGYLTGEQLSDIEDRVNQIILDNIPIQCFYVDDESKYEYRSKKEIDGPLRLCVIDQVDVCACCAPHVRSTIEVGLFKVLKSMKYKSGIRVYLACGMRAVDDYKKKHDEIMHISSLVSLPPYKTSQGVIQLLSQIDTLKQELSQTQKMLIEMKLSQMSHTAYHIEYMPSIDLNTLRNYGLKVFDLVSEDVFLFTGEEMNYQFIYICHDDVMNKLNELKKVLKISGGGKPPMVQGKIENTRNEILQVLKKNA